MIDQTLTLKRLPVYTRTKGIPCTPTPIPSGSDALSISVAICSCWAIGFSRCSFNQSVVASAGAFGLSHPFDQRALDLSVLVEAAQSPDRHMIGRPREGSFDQAAILRVSEQEHRFGRCFLLTGGSERTEAGVTRS